jgi:hypothetical protein
MTRITIAAAAAAALALGLAAAPGPSAAGELDLSLGLDASASGWAGDRIGGAGLELGWAFRPWLQLSFLGRTSYASIDERMLTYLSLGAELRRAIGPTRPYLRAGLVHQHEEPIVAIEHQPIQSLLGVGDGIRHRGGVDLAAGLEVPFHPLRAGDLYGAAQALATWFPDPRGPSWYLTVGLAVGVRWDFARAR